MRAPVFFVIPANTEASRCDGCQKWVYWIRTAAGKRMPVDASEDGGITPTMDEPGRGVAHFATCPQAGRFRRQRPTSRYPHRQAPASSNVIGNYDPAPTPPIADQLSMFDRSADVVAAVTLIADVAHVDGGRILQQSYAAHEAARRAMHRAYGQPNYAAVREAVATLETFYGERW